MKQAEGTGESSTLDRAVFVAPGRHGYTQTLVRHIVWHDGLVHEELQVFSSLAEALAYARSACNSLDGPLAA